MKIIKPQSLGLLQRCHTQGGQHHLVVVALGFFELGKPVPARLLPDTQAWPRAMTALPPGQVLDEVMPKVCAEALLVGRPQLPDPACCEGAAPSTCLDLRLCVGALDKRLVARAPAFVEERPQALGSAQAWPKPQVGYGPLLPTHAQRMQYAGTYDQAWVQQQHPGLPRDLDWRFGQQAPCDQWVPGGLHGGEAYELRGYSTHPQGIQGRLPSQRVRAFALAVDATAPLRELSLQLDTVWFMPAVGLGVLVWRGSTEVADSDALDLAALMLSYAAPDTPPLPLVERERVLRARLDPETAAAHIFNESQLAPPRDAELLAAEALQAAADAAARARMRQARLVAIAAEVGPAASAADLVPPPPALASLPLQPPQRAALAAADVDLGGLLQQAQALAEEAQARGDALRSCLQAPGLGLPPVVMSAAQTGPSAAAVTPQQAAARRASPTVLPGVLCSPALAAARGRELLARLAAGQPLGGLNFAGASLRGAQLSGADLSDTLLERADLRQADMRGCQLNRAVLTAALLDDANLAQAQMMETNLCATQAAGAILNGATGHSLQALHAQWPRVQAVGSVWSSVLFNHANWSGANFEGAQIGESSLCELQAPQARFVGARFARCVLWKAQVAGADFSTSQWSRSAWIAADLSGSRWTGAQLQQLQGGWSDWTGASLHQVRAENCGFVQAQLMGADLSAALFTACDFSRADMQGAKLAHACLPRSQFLQTQMQRLDGQQADFLGALLRKTDFTAADLRGASFMQAACQEVQWRDAQLQGLRLNAKLEAA